MLKTVLCQETGITLNRINIKYLNETQKKRDIKKKRDSRLNSCFIRI